GIVSTKAIAAGNMFSLASAANGSLESWGNNEFGQLGIQQTLLRTTPTLVPGLDGVTQVASTSIPVSFAGTVALKSDGTVWAWGVNTGNSSNSFGSSAGPGQVNGLAGIVQIQP